MPKSPQAEALDELAPFIDQFIRASDRTRSILFIIAGIVALVGTTFLNTRHGGWIWEREQTYASAYTMAKTPTSSLGQLGPTYKKDRDSLKPLEIPLLKGDVHTRPEVGANQFLKAANIYSEDELKKSLELQQSVLHAQNIVEIPLLKVHFDVNDMGLMAGLMLMFLTLTLAAASMRQRENFQIVMGRAEKLSAAADAFDLLRMSEVLHFAESLDVRNNPLKKSGWFMYILYGAPLLTHSLWLLYDGLTIDLGNGWSEANTKAIFFSEVTLWIFVLLATFVAIDVAVSLDQLWTGWENAIKTGTGGPTLADLRTKKAGEIGFRTLVILNGLVLFAAGCFLLLVPSAAAIGTTKSVDMWWSVTVGSLLVVSVIVTRTVFLRRKDFQSVLFGNMASFALLYSVWMTGTVFDNLIPAATVITSKFLCLAIGAFVAVGALLNAIESRTQNSPNDKHSSWAYDPDPIC